MELQRLCEDRREIGRCRCHGFADFDLVAGVLDTEETRVKQRRNWRCRARYWVQSVQPHSHSIM